MWMYKISLALVGLLGLAMVDPTPAQNSPQDYLDAHNAARAAVGVGPMTWSPTVAAFAQNYANQRMEDCRLQHSSNRPYGENIAVGGGDFTGRAAVSLWVAERPNYDHSSNTCAPGRVCGHYTQVVWRNSVRLGCARVRCSTGSWFITCDYDPPGNYVGQRPYSNGVPKNSSQEYLDAHNAARAAVGVGPMTWSAAVAAFAQNYANQRIGDCRLQHSTNRSYGENIAASSGDITVSAAVALWVDEKQYYDYNSNTCAVGHVCGHYTQVVWSNSVRLGCARVQCSAVVDGGLLPATMTLLATPLASVLI